MSKREKAFSLKTVCLIGLRLIQQLEELHQIGYVYNDLKLDNIVIGDKTSSASSLTDIRLIDFGLCTRYIDDNGKHIEMKDESTFQGNMAMGSA